MAFDDGITELLSRNGELLKGKRVLVAGHITSAQILSQIKDCARAFLLTDNHDTARALAAAIAVKMGRGSFERADRKHVTVVFGDCEDERVQSALEEFDVLLLLLDKNKNLTRRELASLHHALADSGTVLIAGSNAMGGKSADGILKNAGSCRKIDSARKCTLFAGKIETPENIGSMPQVPDVTYGGLCLSQRHGLFSQGRLDAGTKLLLNAMHADLTGDMIRDLSVTDLRSLPEANFKGPALDLGCGCGIVGLSLLCRGADTVVATDVSATALLATTVNAEKAGFADALHPLACNMLPSAQDLSETAGGIREGRFAVIATNPPFHEALERNTRAVFDMIAKAGSSLLPGGVLYLVGNNCLHYETPLGEHFESVRVLARNNGFTVFRAAHPKKS